MYCLSIEPWRQGFLRERKRQPSVGRQAGRSANLREGDGAGIGEHTLDVGNALLEDLLERLGVLELLLDLGDDALGKFLLLALLDLALVADPRVEDGLGLGGQGGLLLELVGLRLELGGLLQFPSPLAISFVSSHIVALTRSSSPLVGGNESPGEARDGNP